ncbi:hypothetical protein ACHAXR_006052, partial [Thalassiosira sp. AJA248-18]
AHFYAFQRTGTETVEGCVGVGTHGKDYCAERPDDTLFLRGNNGSPSWNFPLGVTATVVRTLIAKDSYGLEAVPGCNGLGSEGQNYCRYPSLAQSAAYPLGVCEGGCDKDNDCEGSLQCFRRIGTDTVPGCLGEGNFTVGYCIDHSDRYLWLKGENGSPVDAFPLGVCEGGCDRDNDCDDNLICEVRSGLEVEEVPGCNGLGANGQNYCRCPSLVHVGDNGSPAEAFPLGLCEGDCDDDNDCESLLQCFNRGGTQTVLGCSGEGTKGKVYCAFRPDDTLFSKGDNGYPSINFPLGHCDGDCDVDSDCEGSLVCFGRSGTEAVPGCDGLGTSGQDYCYDDGTVP